MTKLFGNIKYDIKAGFARNIWYYIIWIIVITVLSLSIIPNSQVSFSWIDIIEIFMQGVDGNNIFEGNEMVQFPVELVVIQIYIIIGIARFPKQDCDECGYNIWIRTRSKTAWWLSKVIWCFMHVVFMFILEATVIILISYLKTGSFSMETSNFMHMNIPSAMEGKYYCVLFLLPIIVSFTVGIITMSISICFDGVVGVLVGVGVTIMSIFVDNIFSI
ncbi:MAG: hypothetical protein K6G63_00105, partial [Eubacterium sp.]|nr:hypothetical protein [Eubacterium sp.]